MSEEEKQDQGFRVSDRRRFAGSESGEESKEEKTPEAEKKPPESQEAAGGKREHGTNLPVRRPGDRRRKAECLGASI